MAQTSTLTVKLDGTPLVGAEIISCALEVIATTDGDGKISASLPDNFASAVLVAVRHSSLFDRTYTAVCILESGEDYELDIPAIAYVESGASLFGIHGLFVRKL